MKAARRRFCTGGATYTLHSGLRRPCNRRRLPPPGQAAYADCGGCCRHRRRKTDQGPGVRTASTIRAAASAASAQNGYTNWLQWRDGDPLLSSRNGPHAGHAGYAEAIVTQDTTDVFHEAVQYHLNAGATAPSPSMAQRTTLDACGRRILRELTRSTCKVLSL